MRIAILVVGLIGLLASTVNANTFIEGALTEDQNWTVGGSPYIVEGAVWLNDGLSLTIGPGVLIKLQPGASLGAHFECTVDIQGTEFAPVRFTSNTSTPTPGSYDFLYLVPIEGNTTLSHCVIEYAGTGLIVGWSVEANNVEIRNCVNGIEPGLVPVEINGFTVRGNTHFGVYCGELSGATVRNCEVFDNGGTGIWGAPESGSLIVEECIVRNNGGDGIVAKNDVTNCLVENNIGDGIVSMGDVTGCTIQNNGGFGLNLLQGATAIDCTIVGNAGYGVNVREVQPGQSIQVNLCRIYGNGIYDAAVDPSCLPPVIDATHNYWGTADEEEIAERIFDTHDDPSLPSEVLFVPFEAAVGVNEVVPNVGLQLAVHPNPFNPQTTITFALERDEWATIGVYELTGKRVAVLADRTFVAGPHTLTWNGRDAQGYAMPSGTYIVRLETDSSVEARKVMLLR